MILWDARERVAAWVSERTGTPGWGEWYQGIGHERDGELIAGVIFNFWTPADIALHIAADPGAAWLTGEFARAIFGYPFSQLNTRRVSAFPQSKDEGARKLVESLGFSHEGTMRHAYPDDDAEVYGLLKEDCRYL